MYLPGTPSELIGDLRRSRGYSQKELSQLTDIPPSQLSRIESGEIENINSNILVKLAKAFGVSTDYILGLTSISTPKSYDISELGLSEGAIKPIVSKTVDVHTLNRLMESKHFPYLVRLMKSHFEDAAVAGILARNEMIDLATATLDDFRQENPQHKGEVGQDIRLLKSQKLGEHEADMEKIKSTFLMILKDVKQQIIEGKGAEPVVTQEALQGMREQWAATAKPSTTPEDVADMVVGMVGQTGALDENSAELLKQLAVQMFKNAGVERASTDSSSAENV